MPVNYEAITDEISECEAEIVRRHCRIWKLRELMSHPVVLPVIHWKQYRSDMEWTWGEHGPDLSGDLLNDAYGVARAIPENGQGWPVGVSVGGAFLSMDELAELYLGEMD